MTTPARTLLLAFALAWLGGCQSTPKAAKERPYKVRFEGNQSLSSARLSQLIELDLTDFDRSGHRKAYIDDAAYDLEIGYQGIGFPFTVVTYTIEGGSPPSSVHFEIIEGPRTVLREVDFVGMNVLKRANFDKALASKRTPFLQSSLPYYVERDIVTALDTMERQYVDLGYLEADLQLRSTDFNGDRTRARITVDVEEGPRYEVGEARVTPLDLPDGLHAICQGEIDEANERNERAFRQRTGYELRGLVLENLATRGYAEAQVELKQEQRPDAKVDLELKVTLGPKILISDLQFPEGLGTREAFLRSHMEVTEGDVYDSEKVRESVRQLYETGLFTRVVIDLRTPGEDGNEEAVTDEPEEESEEPPTEERRPLVITLREAQTGEVFVEPGYGSYERARLTLGYRKRNIWGSGRLLRLEATAAELAQRASATLTDPWFLGTELSADLSVLYDRRELPSFTQDDLGAGIFWTQEWNVQHATTFGYQYRRSRATDILVVDDAVEEAQNNLNISSVQAAQRMDTRDNFFLPSSGWFNEGTVELGDEAIGSELDFLRTALRTSTYGRVLPRTILAGAFRTGVIFPTGRMGEVPIQERYFNGGQNRVRSFRFDQLGPKDASGNPIGGEAFATANLELRHDLTPRFQGAAFVDAGNVTLNYEDYFDFRDVEFGIGVGLRYLLAIGPVRLDVGWNPDPGPGDPEYVVHFSVGMAF